jgi:hypothetical protein
MLESPPSYFRVDVRAVSAVLLGVWNLSRRRAFSSASSPLFAIRVAAPPATPSIVAVSSASTPTARLAAGVSGRKPFAEGERVAKRIAAALVCSRRAAEEMIAARRVTVNGTLIEAPTMNVTSKDKVVVDGKELAPRAPLTVRPSCAAMARLPPR